MYGLNIIKCGWWKCAAWRASEGQSASRADIVRLVNGWAGGWAAERARGDPAGDPHGQAHIHPHGQVYIQTDKLT